MDNWPFYPSYYYLIDPRWKGLSFWLINNTTAPLNAVLKLRSPKYYVTT